MPVCERCAKEFPPKYRPSRFCSHKCSHADWVDRNRERRNEHQRTYDQSEHGKEQRKEWAAGNADYLRGYKRRHYLENKDQYLQRISEWSKENPEKRKAISSKYGKTPRGREVSNEATHRRRARKTKAGGSFTRAEFRALCERNGHRCLCCGATDVKLTPDHVVSIVAGGTNDIGNIQPLCMPCNRRKGAGSTDYRPG